MLIINTLINSVIQILLFLIIPFIWWLFTVKNEVNFLNWLGIQKPQIKNKTKYLFYFLVIFIILFVPSFLMSSIFIDTSNLATNQFFDQGISALIPALIYPFLQTGFSEELFFRGFLAKRFIRNFGFKKGNLLQSLIFGLLHGIMFYSTTNLFKALLITITTSVAGYLFAWINEKITNGSIFTSWAIHSLSNFIASVFTMFNVF